MDVFEQTAPIYMHGMIFGAMAESFCAEQSARMTAMDSATKSANDMIRDLQLEYNRTRQLHHSGDHRDHRRRVCGEITRITSPSALARCHLSYRGEALAFRKASSLRQRLPY